MITKMLIGGNWVNAADNKTFEVSDPRTGLPFASVPLGGIRDADAAVDAACLAFKSWAKTNVFARAALLRDAGALVEKNKQEIGRLMSREQGKPAQEAITEVQKAADILRYYAAEGERVYGRIIPSDESGTFSMVVYQPIGPCAAITPWNYPVELLAWKIGAALAAGCTLVCKLPSETPLCALLFIKYITDAGLPGGVINALTGEGKVIGQRILERKEIRKAAFTGSTAVGKDVLASCTESLRRSSMELGGSLPMLVFKDCDLDSAAIGAARRSFKNMGQICIAINRIYAEREIYEQFLSRFKEETEKLIIGDGLDGTADLGPMCKKQGVEAVTAHISDAIEKGARLITGGKAPVIPGFESGNWFSPTILADTDHSMKIMSEETFGPAVGVMPFDSMEEAVNLANDSIYGLAAIIYTQNLATVNYCAQALEAGNVAVNNVDAGTINAPYGGWKQSGFGHEHGPEGLYEYLNVKHVRIHAGGE
ncbi:MAG: NAD-dependent succinate-semialdehyde dehydrogenase [Oscillospiraceae bacterium]|nr:NAD-dependent succinate-semialdehyde dehydrogenase [Oscillospiraceae bacterium]